MVAKILRFTWLLLKNIPLVKDLIFYLLRNSRYFFWRYRGGKPVQLGPGNINFLKEISNQIGEDENFYLIEFGCAAGPSLIELSKLYPKSNFVGFDIRKGAVRDGQQYIKSNSIKNVSLKNTNLIDLDEDINCDYLISRATLIYLSPKDLRSLLIKVKSKVKKKIIFQEIHSSSNLTIMHYYFAHPFKKVFEELGYGKDFNIKMTNMNFEPWESQKWQGVCIVLERKRM